MVIVRASSRLTTHLLRASFPRPNPNYSCSRSFSCNDIFQSSKVEAPRASQEEADLGNVKRFLGTSKRLQEFNLSGKVVLVSGGARGLGLCMAEALLEAGASVYALDRLPEAERSPEFSKIEERANNELGTKLHYRQIDVRNVPKLNEIVSAIGDREGKIDGLIAAAGINEEMPAIDYTPELANRVFDINITGVFMTSQAVARQMIKYKTGGSIVMVASMSGTVVNKGLPIAAYNASKAGVIQLGRNLAAEWGQHGIRVNTLSPGYCVTEMTEELFQRFPERRTQWTSENMLGRLSKPTEYRGAAVFLVSEASSFMTGSDLRIDGGHAACVGQRPHQRYLRWQQINAATLEQGRRNDVIAAFSRAGLSLGEGSTKCGVEKPLEARARATEPY